MKIGLAQIIKTTSELSTKKEKVEWLQKNDSIPLRVLLKAANDPNLKWALPPGDPPYKPSNLTDCEGMLYTEIDRFYLFLEGGHQTLAGKRREELFIQMLESIDAEDAKLVCAVKEKTLPYKLPKKIIQEAFPGLI